MSGRQPPHGMIDDPRHHHHHRRGPPPPSTTLILEERMSAQRRDIQALLVDNQRLGATHMALKQELALAERELHHLESAARGARGGREAELKEVYEKAAKLEGEVRAVSGMRAETAAVREDVQRLSESKIEMSGKLMGLESELKRVRGQVRDLPAVRADLDAMRQELQKGRAAIEFEKKTRASNLEQRRAMERNMATLQHEIDRLVAELADAEKRARAAAAVAANPNPGYMGNYGGPNMSFAGSSYPMQYPMHHQVPMNADGVSPSPYRPPMAGYGAHDVLPTYVPKG